MVVVGWGPVAVREAAAGARGGKGLAAAAARRQPGRPRAPAGQVHATGRMRAAAAGGAARTADAARAAADGAGAPVGGGAPRACAARGRARGGPALRRRPQKTGSRRARAIAAAGAGPGRRRGAPRPAAIGRRAGRLPPTPARASTDPTAGGAHLCRPRNALLVRPAELPEARGLGRLHPVRVGRSRGKVFEAGSSPEGRGRVTASSMVL